MSKDSILHKNKDLVARVIDDETILLPIYKTSEEINCIYSLNKTASRVWELIDGKRTLGQIKKQVLEEFDTTSEEVDKEMRKFLGNLKEIKAVINR